MATQSSPIRSTAPSAEFGIRAWIKCHPVITYFTLAFACTWLAFSPILFSKHGLGTIDLPGGAAFLLFILATYTGPFLAALVTTSLVDGKTGVRDWLRRIVQWRVGIRWYLLVLIGYPFIFLIGIVTVLGPSVLSSVTQNWPMFFGLYLPQIPIGFLLPTLGEETGWRGFALPRLQQAHGPFIASLILGIMHALWHLPIYFVRGMIDNPTGFDLIQFTGNSLAIFAGTFVWTWLFNNARGSIFFATIVHAASNANGALIQNMLSLKPEDITAHPWFAFEVMGIAALVVIILTRGRLGYKNPKHKEGGI